MNGGSLRVRSFTLGPFATNCYLLWQDGHPSAWVVDASWGAERIVNDVRTLGLRVERLILTHAHVDHIAGVDPLIRELARANQTPTLMIHRLEAHWLNNPMLNLSELGGEPVTCREANELLDGGERLTLGGSDPLLFEVTHTPGHSPGGICLLCAQAGVALVGDALMQGSVGRTDFPGGSFEILATSIRRTLYRLPRATSVLSGHGAPTTIGREMDSNPFVPHRP